MSKTDVLRNIEAYLDGSLSEIARLEFETLAATDPTVRRALDQAQRLDALLMTQSWLSPSDGFTQAVMAKVGLSPSFESDLAPVSRRELIMDWIQGLAPAAAVAAFAIMFGRALINSFMVHLNSAARLLDSAMGTQVFSNQPLILVGLVTPLLGVLIVSATVTRRLRLAS